MMTRKIIIICTLLISILLTGCTLGVAANGREYTEEELQRLARIEIYSAEDNSLLNTIEDKEILYQFNNLDGLNELKADNTEMFPPRSNAPQSPPCAVHESLNRMSLNSALQQESV